MACRVCSVNISWATTVCTSRKLYIYIMLKILLIKLLHFHHGTLDHPVIMLKKWLVRLLHDCSLHLLMLHHQVITLGETATALVPHGY